MGNRYRRLIGRIASSSLEYLPDIVLWTAFGCRKCPSTDPGPTRRLEGNNHRARFHRHRTWVIRMPFLQEMVSLIRSFPLCNSLFLRGCVTRGKPAVGNVFAGLPEHKLSIKDLQLSSSSSTGTLIDVSNLIEDAALGVESLAALVCDVGSSEKTRRVAAAVSASPAEQFQVACREPGGFQGGRTPLNSRRRRI